MKLLAFVAAIGATAALTIPDVSRADALRTLALPLGGYATFRVGAALSVVGASGTVWGAALRANTEANFRPTYVSAGPGVSLETAVGLAFACRRYRVPEPVRLAELEGRVALREYGGVD